MTALNHVLTGSAIALAVRNPLLAAPLALLSHFILDVVPHFDAPFYRYGSRWFTIIMSSDGVLSLAAVIILIIIFPHLAGVIALCAFCGVLPDLFWLYYYQHGRPQTWFFKFHTKIQWFERPQGALVEASYLIFISLLIVTIK